MSTALYNTMRQYGATVILAKAESGRIVDIGPSGLTGVIKGPGTAASPLVRSRFTSSLSGDGVAAHATMLDAGGVMGVVDPYTIVFWASITDIGVSAIDVLEYGSDTNGFRVITNNWNASNRQLVVRTRVGGVATNRATSTTFSSYFTPGRPFMCAIVLSSAAITFYIDAKTSNTTSGGASIANVDTTYLYMMRRKQVASPTYCEGYVLPAAFFPSVALTAVQVADLYRLGGIDSEHKSLGAA